MLYSLGVLKDRRRTLQAVLLAAALLWPWNRAAPVHADGTRVLANGFELAGTGITVLSAGRKDGHRSLSGTVAANDQAFHFETRRGVRRRGTGPGYEMDLCILDAARRPLLTSYGGDEALIPECDDEPAEHDQGQETFTEALAHMHEESHDEGHDHREEPGHHNRFADRDPTRDEGALQITAAKAIHRALRKVRFRKEFAPEYRALVGESKALSRTPVGIPAPDDPRFIREMLPDGGVVIHRAP